MTLLNERGTYEKSKYQKSYGLSVWIHYGENARGNYRNQALYNWLYQQEEEEYYLCKKSSGFLVGLFARSIICGMLDANLECF